ncbi:enoyl-CoA hydratase/isomerase family protein [Parahaliea mediterranea]|uniref:enoyl-CoA hydratase/isomerase family protein n=1 Tax=Parahaliea mediterranea TaxID=651086 RepID=UPI000E2E4C81|nr:enoyl-CoA hydratase/isomerase family protein [Parahaliea mediterranea]
MSALETVTIERHDNVALVSLNRPDSLNAFSAELRRDIGAAVDEVNADDSIRVVVLTGVGRAFSAGADLMEVQGDDFDVRRQLNEEYKPVLMAISESGKPWISAVNGAAAGIGSAFAMVCDLTVMAEDAFIYQAFAAIGLVPDGGATWHLARSIGRKRAFELIATGEKLRAEKCQALGLCNRVVPADELVPATLAWAQELAGKAPLALRYAKQALNQAMEADVAEIISAEADLQHLCINSADAAEGVKAFVEKRAPVWQGK